MNRPITTLLSAAAIAAAGLAQAQTAPAEEPAAQPTQPPPGQAPPAPPENPGTPPQQAEPQEAQPAPAQPSPSGQWVYTSQYGWLWMPYAQSYTYVPAEGMPQMYVYYPALGWRWVVAPWVFRWGPRPYWHAHPWFRVPPRSYYHRYHHPAPVRPHPGGHHRR
jgi:hypothetical protein